MKIQPRFVLKLAYTKGQLPVSLLSSVIHDYLNGGKFSADLSYKFPTKTLFGPMDLYDVTHKDYLYLEHAKFNIEGNDKIILHSKGNVKVQLKDLR